MTGRFLGLERDLGLSPRGADGLERFYRQALVDAMGAKFALGAQVEFVSVGGKTVCRIDVVPSAKPVFLEKKIEGRIEKEFLSGKAAARGRSTRRWHTSTSNCIGSWA
jgi:hypothetical protein